MSILVVGVSGTVGALLYPHFQTIAGAAPFVYQRRGDGQDRDDGTNLDWDPDDGPHALRLWTDDHEISEAMIVLAGVTPRSGRDLGGNADIARVCLDAARAVGIRRVLVASSSAVYGNHIPRPFAETDAPRPVNPYGEAKLAMEAVCADAREAGLDVVALRIGNVAGADALLAQEKTDQPLALDTFPDGGTPLRSYIGPGTMAHVLHGLAHAPAPLPALLNIAAPEPVEMGALADAAGRAWVPRQRVDTTGQRIVMDCRRLWSMLPVPPGGTDAAAMVAQIERSPRAV